MNNQELDRLFRQKFDDLREEPSPQAWQQLQNQLQQKKGRRFWGYFSGIAASLLMLFGIWAAMEYSQAIPPAERIVQSNQPEEVNQPHQIAEEVVQQDTSSEKKETPLLSKTKQENEMVAKKEVKEAVAPVETPPSASVLAQSTERAPARRAPKKSVAAQASELEVMESPKPKSSLIAEATPDSLPAQANSPKESIIIRYNAADAPEQALAQKDEVDKSEDKKEKGKEISARKIIGFLKKVKTNGGENLAELREAKDELLSFRLGKAD